MSVFVSRHGDDRGAGPVLVLLHGLGATDEVWSDFVAVAGGGWPGPVLVPDLPGTGVLGHSRGGVVG